MKNLRKILLTVFIMGLCLGGSMMFSSHASALTKKQVNKKIVTLKKDIKKLNKQQKKEAAKEKKQRKGTVSVFGSTIYTEPCIVRATFSGTYYYVKNASNLLGYFGTVSGYAKKTGKIKKFNGLPCVVVKAVKVTHKASKIKSKITKKKETLTNYKNSLKNKIYMSSTTMALGTTDFIDWSWRYTAYYNDVTFTSSNTKVATIDSIGIMKAKGLGTTTITAKSTISGAVTKATVKVQYGKLEVATESHTSDKIANGGTLDFYGTYGGFDLHTFYSDKEVTGVTYSISDDSIAEISSTGYISVKAEGSATITIEYMGTKMSFTLNVKKEY